MTKIESYWIDERNNKWFIFLKTEESAKINSKSLTNCTNCYNCIDCTNCTNCTNCYNCTNFKQNPARIYSKLIGSRKKQTTAYISVEDKKHTQVICGCFNGTFEEFKDKCQKSYPNISKGHRKEYYDFCNIVQQLIDL